VLASGADAVFVSADELAWGTACPGTGARLLAPNLLPRAAEEDASRIASVRRDARVPRLAYVGTLTFPPNVASLLRWLDEHWAGVRARLPGAELVVAGRCSDDVRAAVGRHPGVRAVGFVDDLAEVLGDAAAAVLPFDGDGGSSLRFLHFALARVPVVATAGAAERGLPFRPGLLARTTEEWADALAACVERDERVARAVSEAEAETRALHDDPAPWDALWRVVAGGDAARPREEVPA
jgi:glycosyltransferase involved in cell wall biosynthesis